MTTTHDLAIEAAGLTKRFGATVALDGVDLAAPRGTVLGVLGPNGAGKTTAVRILATLLRPDGGTARVAGHDVLRDPAAVRRQIGLTGQYASVDELLTGRQNLVMIGRLLDLKPRDAKARAAELLDWFDLDDAADRPAKTYSGGMRRRLDLAASLVGRPAVVFLDEPTTGLDPSKRDDMWDVVRGLVRDGSTVLLTTQYLEEADELADDIVVFDHGRVIAHGTPDVLKRIAGDQTHHRAPRRPRGARAFVARSSGRRPGPTPRSRRAAPSPPPPAATRLRRHRRRPRRRRHRGDRAVAAPAQPRRGLLRAHAQGDQGARLRGGGGMTHAPPQRRHRQAQPDRDHADPGGARRRDAAADHLPAAVHLRVRRRHRRRLAARLPAVPAPGPARPDDRDGRRVDRREPQHRRREGRLRPLPQPADRQGGPARRRSPRGHRRATSCCAS